MRFEVHGSNVASFGLVPEVGREDGIVWADANVALMAARRQGARHGARRWEETFEFTGLGRLASSGVICWQETGFSGDRVREGFKSRGMVGAG